MTTTTTKDEAEIRELVTAQVAAMRERDAERIVARYTADVVLYDLAPPLRQTTAYATDPERVRAWFEGFDGQIDYEVRDLETTVGSDVAYAHSLNRVTATPHGSPESFTLWFRATYGLRKVDGDWRIAHEHESTPFYMDGQFGAAIDLEP
ncbi:MAG: YybH family protein [Nocardioidaceae bacterium]